MDVFLGVSACYRALGKKIAGLMNQGVLAVVVTHCPACERIVLFTRGNDNPDQRYYCEDCVSIKNSEEGG